MEAAALWVSLVSAMATIAAAVFTFVQAKAATDERQEAEEARDESRKARDEAAALAREANEAFKRQAEAQERANEIAQRALPKPAIKWEVHQIGSSRWRATNVGELVAFDARIEQVAGWVSPDDDDPRDVGPGDSLIFNCMSTGGESARIRIVSFERTEDGERELRNEVTMP